MSKRYNKAKLSFLCPKCQVGLLTRNRCPKCPSCKTALRVTKTNPHLRVVVRRKRGEPRKK